MKTIFIINPKAGQKKDIDKIIEEIRAVSKEINATVDTYITECPGDGERYVREYCMSGEKARFIACGGDGTLGEVVNGAYGFEGVEVGVIPMGTGNDFCRNFPRRDVFSDIRAQLSGKTMKCDLIRYTTNEKTRYCVNMFNIGFDCNVADMTNTMKTKPFISGSLAYFLSIFCILVKKKGANLKIDLDGKEIHHGPLLLTTIANGSFCGGGVKSNPGASVSDGMMDVNVVYNVSRLTFISKLPYYMKGTHTKLKNIEKIIATFKSRKITITPQDGMRLCIDGEISDAGKTEFEIVKDGFSFVLPKAST